MQEQLSSEFREKEHILVCLSTSPSNARIIQTAASLSSVFFGELTALFVETPSYKRASEEDK
ncbi:MAG: universal stress protein, partial [Fusicatenibacter sp.]|nr:universal stress protein [Fusicatenibacter sp.]